MPHSPHETFNAESIHARPAGERSALSRVPERAPGDAAGLARAAAQPGRAAQPAQPAGRCGQGEREASSRARATEFRDAPGIRRVRKPKHEGWRYRCGLVVGSDPDSQVSGRTGPGGIRVSHLDFRESPGFFKPPGMAKRLR